MYLILQLGMTESDLPNVQQWMREDGHERARLDKWLSWISRNRGPKRADLSPGVVAQKPGCSKEDYCPHPKHDDLKRMVTELIADACYRSPDRHELDISRSGSFDGLVGRRIRVVWTDGEYDGTIVRYDANVSKLKGK